MSSQERPAAKIPAVCHPTLYKRGCVCERCRAHDNALIREERERRIKEGLAHGQ